MFRDAPRSRLVLALLVTAAVALIVLDSRAGGGPVTDTGRRAGELVFAPASSAVSAAAGPVTDLYDGLRAGPAAADRIEELERDNAELRERLRAAELDEERAQQLDELLHLSGRGGYEIVAAQAVTRVTSHGYGRTVTLDAGSDSGITADMTVVNGQGLVGRVVEVGKRTSTVMLATDVASAVGVRLEGTRKIGVAKGGSVPGGPDADLTLELFDLETPVEDGDRLVTLGSHDGAPFVPGVPVGTVEAVQMSPGALSRLARIAPVVDFAALDVVGVVVSGPAEDPRDSVLPSQPDPEEDR
ncbi:rod shape-determining protein MreC [Nocardiopsis sp. CNT312]|uniref:rod shape-determining protein MreC n=1 Tax=Nocardiopsis sp. CNT312 TaxID=1137268 RepID=UPI0004913EFA|nr:rod shape-determining protein MreC [Nocardiopsis sp. CNT312]